MAKTSPTKAQLAEALLNSTRQLYDLTQGRTEGELTESVGETVTTNRELLRELGMIEPDQFLFDGEPVEDADAEATVEA